MSQSNSSMTRAWVEIDLGALLRNGASVRDRAGVPLLPMVKADAYGLGAIAVSRALESLDPWGFGVATIPEAEELRRAGIERPIICFTPLLLDDLDAARRARVTPALGDAKTIARWAASGRPWHLAIDTGMSRAGVAWHALDALLDLVRQSPPEGAFTHFHSAQRNDRTRDVQEERFAAALAKLPARPPFVHAENSAAVEHRAPSHWSFARPGVFLYGVGTHGALEPAPVASLRARVVDLREVPDGDTVSYDGSYRAVGARRIATLGIGYADGYRRALSNRGSALVNGRRAPVAGLVTMDMTMIDVTDVPCEIGDVATLMGRDGDERIDIADLALDGDLSPYEVLTGLRGRLPRRYLGGALEALP
jgi:alanine racemase